MLKSLTSTPQHLLRAPPQLGVGPPAQYFSEQKQDHFDPSSSRTWSQAFFVNDTFWRPGSDAPIFLCVGLSSHVRPGASVLHVQATRTSLLRAVRTRGAGQLVRHRTYAARVRASGVPYVARTVTPQTLVRG